MPVLPLELPPGMFRNGTDYAARNRWSDGNLIRWHDGSLRPIGGWVARATSPIITTTLTAEEAIRDIQTFVTNVGNREALLFSNKRVFRMNSGNLIADVTPAGYFQGQSQPTTKTGYGTGAYGSGPYGARQSTDGLDLDPVDRVVHDMWGENVLYAVVNEGPIYQHIVGNVPATPLGNAPTDVADMIVTDQRIVMVIKNDPEIRRILWSDREDNTEWTPTPSNFADDRRLQGNGKLLGLYKIQNQILVLSETDAHVGRYIGAPFVYGFERVGENCGPVWRSAVQATDRFVVWMGRRNFWIYDGTIRKLPCDVMDFLVDDANPDMVSKIHCTTIAKFSEIWWYYQSKGSATNDVDSYVVYDYVENHWTTGRLERTASADSGALVEVIKVGQDGVIYNHEIPNVKVDGAAFAITGPLELSVGNKNMALRYVLPDTDQKGDVELYFHTRQMPTEPDYTHGPFEYENPISVTGVLGREVRMEVQGLTNRWEVGTMRVDVQVVGGGFR